MNREERINQVNYTTVDISLGNIIRRLKDLPSPGPWIILSVFSIVSRSFRFKYDNG